MAHECPDCGQLCHCGGDIDDCEFNFPEDVMRCTHYKECQKENEDNEGIEYENEDNEGIEYEND